VATLTGAVCIHVRILIWPSSSELFKQRCPCYVHTRQLSTSAFTTAVRYCICKFGLGRLAFSDSEFDFWNLWIHFWTFGRTPWTGISPSQGHYLHRTQKNADTHPCLERDSKPRSQCSSGWRP